MDLVEAYSNLPDHVERLRALLALPRAARPKRSGRPPKQPQKRLDAEGVAQLVAAHVAGASVKRLAAQFGINRHTVHGILKREGVLRRPGLLPDDLPDVIRLYQDGWSTAQLGGQFDVSPNTINRALRQAGVAVRPPRGRGSFT